MAMKTILIILLFFAPCISFDCEPQSTDSSGEMLERLSNGL